MAEPIELTGAVAILEVARRLGATIDLDELLDLIVNETIKVLACDRASIFLHEADAHEFVTKVAHGLGLVRLSADRGILGACARQRCLVNVPDAYADDRFNPDVDRQTGYRTRNILSCPLIGYDGQLVGVVQAVNKHDGAFGAGDERLLEALGAQAAVALQRARLLQEYAKKQRMEQELQLAREIQQGLLPRDNPRIDGYQIVGWNRPADETGGDGYDFISLSDDRLGVVLADASGHGIAPALVVAQLQAMLRVLLSSMDLGHCRVLQCVNKRLAADLPPDRFVTAFCGVLDTRRHILHYCSAGQGPILHVRRGGRLARFDATACPLGILPEMEFHTDAPIHLQVGESVVLVTDGFYEWSNSREEQFGLERLERLVVDLAEHSAQAILEGIRRDVNRFAEGTLQRDDLTAIVIKRTA